jgi:hypothetical protein
MPVAYKVKSFVPTLKGCNSVDAGWDTERCENFQKFINEHAQDGWVLHSYEYRQVTVKGCGGGRGQWLVCIFERKN